MGNKTWMVVIPLFFCLWTSSRAQQPDTLLPKLTEERPPTVDELMRYEEQLRYQIKFSFLTLGWINVNVVRDSIIDGRPAWLLRSQVVANSKIPFVKKDTTRFNSWMVEQDSSFYSHLFWFDDVDDNLYKENVYFFDRKNQKVHLRHRQKPDETLELIEPASSGHILIYFTRLFAGTERHFEAPVYVEEGLGKIIMDFTSRRERREYDAFENKITTYYAEGTSTITGPFGLNGDFQVWYATDRLRIPVEAHFNVFIGKVKLQLTEYSRKIRNHKTYGQSNSAN